MNSGIIIKKGNSVKVYQKISEGKRDRVVAFRGKIINVKGFGLNKMFTVRQTIESIDVDRIFPVESPTILKIEKVEEKSTKKASTLIKRTKSSRSKKTKSSK